MMQLVHTRSAMNATVRNSYSHGGSLVDETWARAYEPQLKRQLNEWRRHGSPQNVTVGQTANNVKLW